MHRTVLIGVALVLHSTVASAQSRTDEATPEAASSSSAAQVLYKGLVGNLLEAVPLETRERVQAQRLSSMVTSPLSARSVAVALGVASPPLMIIGLIWGLWSANQIGSTDAVDVRAEGGRQPDAATSGGPSNLELALSPRESVDAFARTTGLVDTSALARVMGAGANNDRIVPCDNCFMPMLYPRAAPDVR